MKSQLTKTQVHKVAKGRWQDLLKRLRFLTQHKKPPPITAG